MSTAETLQQPTAADSSDEAFRWRLAARREELRWSHPWPCSVCGEWVGHWGGSAERPSCNCIPLNVPLEEVRPNCFTVRRHWMGDAIRAVTDRLKAEA